MAKVSRSEANARLMAAAPDLLQALYDLLEDVPYACDGERCECGEYDEAGSCVHTRAWVALAKATGA